MKKLNVLFLIILFCAFAVPAFAQDKVYVLGNYSIVEPSKDFANISEIHIAAEHGEMQNSKFYGSIRLKNKNAEDFQINLISRSGTFFLFSTKRIGKIKYSFVGTFSRLGDFTKLRPNGEVLLKGTLVKFWGKKKIASEVVKFSYQAGD